MSLDDPEAELTAPLELRLTYLRLPIDPNLGRWSGRRCAVLGTAHRPNPRAPELSVPWHRVEGPYFVVDAPDGWLVVDKSDGMVWLEGIGRPWR